MSPLRLAETFCAVVPLLGLSVTDAVLPYALVRPYSNCAVEALPLGLTVPFRVAVVCIMLVGAVTVAVPREALLVFASAPAARRAVQ